MKKSEIRPALDALRRIKMPKIEDKDFRGQIIELHFNLFKIGKAVDADIEALRSAYLSSFEEQMQAMNPTKEIDKDSDLYHAITEYNKALDKMLDEEVEITPINGEEFVKEYAGQDYDPSVTEALFPLFL